MNDIDELVTLIFSLGGHATAGQIVSLYCKKHHMIYQSHYKATVVANLKAHSDMVKYIPDTAEWYIVDEEDVVSPHTTSSSNGDKILEGSPEWFWNRSQTAEMQKRIAYIDELRKDFCRKFSAEAIRDMTGLQLLNQVFADKDSMLYLLTLDDTYRNFGAGSKFAYLWPMRYFPETGESVRYAKSKAIPVEKEKAEDTAAEIGRQLVAAIDCIKDIGSFDGIDDYESLDKKISSISFGKFPWALKYYQMLFPEYFPGMYADHTLYRAIDVFGLTKHGNKRLLNMGEVSLYIRKCGVDCITFNHLYGDHWTWEGEPGPCEYVKSKAL